MKDNMKKINKESLKKVSILTLVAAIVLIVGGTLATFNFDTLFEGLSSNKLSTCKLSLNVKDDNPITLVEAYPISDDKAKEYTPYTFTVTNKSDCDTAHYKITLGDICSTCSKTNDICIVNGQELNCSSTYKISPSKIKYQLVNKKINETTTNVNPENIALTGQIAKDEAISFELKLWIDSAAANEDLYVYENDKPKTNSDGSIVTRNAGYKLNVEGQNSEFIDNLDNSGANTPLLTSNMIPVYYDESDSNWKKADNTNTDETYKWYDYNQKKWANAVTVSNTNRATYLSASAGTTIPMSDINAMFVWIPRYKYTYFASNTPTEIPITFENGTASTGTIKCTDAIVASSGKSEICTDSTNGGLAVGTSTYTHPAFTFGNEELTGLWVGKFENSATVLPTTTSTELRTVIIKPDVVSLGNTAISYFANSIRSMELSNNIHGFTQTGTTLNTYTGEISGDSNNLDTHMIKNMEWGAVAYLSHSKYGKNSEVFINNSEGYYTGRSGGNVGGSTPINGTYTDQTSTTKWNTYGFYTYDGYLLNYNTNNKSTIRDLSKVASTTGNIYGIYDMAGGCYDYVMGNMQDSSNAFYPVSSGTWSATNKPLDKYYDKYSFDETESATEYDYYKLGDATIEMKPDAETSHNWYDDTAYSPILDSPWLLRSGTYDDGTSAGVFYIDVNGGRASSNYSTHSVLSVSP